MKKELIAAGLVIFSLILPLKASAASFAKFFVFGDSLSDTGNLYNATSKQFPLSPPNYEGRASNGKVWVDYVGSELGLSPTLFTERLTTNSTEGINYAYGGSSSGIEYVSLPQASLPKVERQVNLFTQVLVNSNQKADPDALYAVWGGVNDYLGGGVTDPTIPITNLANAVKSLATVGARNIMVFNLPDLGKLPSTSSNLEDATRLSTLTALHNASLSATLTDLSKQLGVNIIPVDFHESVQAL